MQQNGFVEVEYVLFVGHFRFLLQEPFQVLVVAMLQPFTDEVLSVETYISGSRDRRDGRGREMATSNWSLAKSTLQAPPCLWAAAMSGPAIASMPDARWFTTLWLTSWKMLGSPTSFVLIRKKMTSGLMVIPWTKTVKRTTTMIVRMKRPRSGKVSTMVTTRENPTAPRRLH